MKQIFDDKFLTLELDSEKSIFIYTWKATSEDLTLDELLRESKIILSSFLESRAEYIIGEDTNFRYAISPAVQVEMNKSILSVLNRTQVKKFAHVESTETITQLGITQFFDENADKIYEDKYFDKLKDAMEWCNS